jgi:ankyrin repeat protein
LAAAAESGQLRTVNLLLQHGARVSYPPPPENPHADISTPLWGAVKGGNIDIVQYLCEKLFWKRKKHLAYALCRAVMAGKEEMVKHLLDAGADPSSSWPRGSHRERSGTVLHLAAENRNELICKLLLEKGIKDRFAVNLFSKPTAFSISATNGHTGLVKLLLFERSKTTVLRSHREAVFLLAAEHGHLEVLSLLLDDGVNIFAESPCSHTNALSFAAGEGHTLLVKSLLSRGWNADNLTAQRSQALRSAVLGKHTEIASLLVESGVEIEQLSPDSKLTPLEMAILGQDRSTVELLLESGANPKRVTTSRLDLVMISGLAQGKLGKKKHIWRFSLTQPPPTFPQKESHHSTSPVPPTLPWPSYFSSCTMAPILAPAIPTHYHPSTTPTPTSFPQSPLFSRTGGVAKLMAKMRHKKKKKKKSPGRVRNVPFASASGAVEFCQEACIE